ncbi:MAG: sugar isomerase domain-containing protein [Erysipelotrichaceae bacterium]
MLKERFFLEAEKLFETIRNTQTTAIEQAGEHIADKIVNGGNVYLFDTGHIVDSEIYNRVGGLVLMRRFTYDIQVNDHSREKNCRDFRHEENMGGVTRYILQLSNLKSGDVLIIGSVSGKTINVVDLAIEARKMGIFVVSLTSVVFSSQLTSLHASKQLLYEVSDFVLDNCAPYGDAMMDVEGLSSKIIPASGLAAAYIMWALNAQIIECLMKRGIEPGVLRSVNIEGNREYNQTLEQRYIEKGY